MAPFGRRYEDGTFNPETFIFLSLKYSVMTLLGRSERRGTANNWPSAS